MEKVTRLFDCMDLQAKEPQTNLLNSKVNGVWQSYSTQSVHTMVYQLAIALLDMGVSAGDGTVEGRDKIGLVSNGRPEWLITDLAVQQTGAILVPLYPNTSNRELEQILNEAEVKYLFISSADLCDKITSIRGNVPSLKAIFTFDEVKGCTNWLKLLKPLAGDYRAKLKKTSDTVTEDTVATIIYTSGTTGKPKGVMLTHKNIVSNVYGSGDVLGKIPIDHKSALSFLPLNHIFEKTCSYVYFFYGFRIYYAENMDTIGANMRETKPYIFTAVPRLLEKVFERIMVEGQKLTGIKRKIFLWSVSLAGKFEIDKQSSWFKLQLSIADKLVYSKWRNAIGGNIKAIIIGSSACPIKLEKIFTAAGMVVMEGYGLTETSPVISVNSYQTEGRKFGTIGKLITDVQVKIAGDGEILCKGPNIMKGYYKNPDMTNEVIIDGWFHTGDIGMLDEDGFLKITDRKKEIFKTSGGKYVAPSPIENRMKENHFIEQMMVVGAGKKFTAALIVPSLTNLKPWCQQNNITYTTIKELVKNEKVKAMYQSIIDSYNPEFNHVEQVKKISLLPEEWSIESGELTPTGKIKRKIITEKYQAQIDSLYENDINEKAATGR